jgi:hypothetical protein
MAVQVSYLKKRKRQSELSLQQHLVKTLALVLPKDVFFTHFPMGGGGSEHGARLNSMGAVAGFPDLLFIYQGRAYGLELKSKGGELSANQRFTFARLWDCGMKIEVARSEPEALARLREMGIPLRVKEPASLAMGVRA